MMNPLVLRLPDEDRALLVFEARKQKQSLAEIVRKAIKAYLKTKPTKSGAQVLLEWAKKNKSYKSTDKDTGLSTTYKQYLYGPKSAKFGHLWKKKK